MGPRSLLTVTCETDIYDAAAKIKKKNSIMGTSSCGSAKITPEPRACMSGYNMCVCGIYIHYTHTHTHTHTLTHSLTLSLSLSLCHSLAHRY